MDTEFGLNHALYIVEAALLALVIYWQGRKRRKNKLGPAKRYSFDNAAPFELPFAVNGRLPVVPYEEVVPGLRIGCDTRRESKIFLSQAINPAPGSPDVGMTYVLSICLEDVRDCNWVSVERTTETLDPSGNYTFSVCIGARSLEKAAVTAELSLQCVGMEPRRILLGAMSLTAQFQQFTFSTQLNGEMMSNIDPSKNSRVLMFLPLENGISIDLEKFEIEVERS